MERNEQANLLSIFSFIFAGIQALALFLIGLYMFVMIAMMASSLLSATNTEPAVYIFPIFLTVLFAVLVTFGAVNVWLNVKLGRMLRSSHLPTQKRVVVTSIFNICSFLCGGIFIMPFGMALGIFGIVFANSDKGKAFLNGVPSNLIGTPPPPVAYAQSNPEGHTWR